MNTTFTQHKIDRVFLTLVSVDTTLKKDFDTYLLEEYHNDNQERLDYIDIAAIARLVVVRIREGRLEFLDYFFSQVELILHSCDAYVENLIVVGLFEGIQNISGSDIDYYHGFNQWLKPKSKTLWDNLIDGWEGTEWRQK